MKSEPQIIVGGNHSDSRGTICFVNDFNMEEIKRFYCIKHHDTSVMRGWRAHRIEQRWFYVYKGVFEVRLVEIDNWTNPDPCLEQMVIVLDAKNNSVLHVPKGYATCLQALENDSELMAYGDYAIQHAANDDYLFPVNYFKNLRTQTA
jgi:dTDP-4-dehydrorhamnose 3,5-epimerase